MAIPNVKLEVKQMPKLPDETLKSRDLINTMMGNVLQECFKQLDSQNPQQVVNMLRGLQLGLAFNTGMAEGMIGIFFADDSSEKAGLETVLEHERNRYVAQGKKEAGRMATLPGPTEPTPG